MADQYRVCEPIVVQVWSVCGKGWAVISAYVQEEAVLTGGGGRMWHVGGVSLPHTVVTLHDRGTKPLVDA